MLVWVSRHGIVTVDQIASKFFPTPHGKSAAFQRVRKLCDASPPLLQRDRTHYREPSVLRITTAGAKLADTGLAPARIVHAEVHHALALVDLAEALSAEHPEATLLTERERRADRYRDKRAGKRKTTGRIPERTAAIVALWVAVLSGIGSVVVTAFGVGVSGHVAGVLTFNSHTSGGVVIISAVLAFFVGFGTGFAAVYTSSTLGAVSIVAASLVVGIILGLIFGLVSVAMEWRMLMWRGYRNPSRREWELHLANAMQTVIDNMMLKSLPRIMVMDSPVPQAWTYARTIVVSKGIIEGLDAAELAGVLAHEVTHWKRGDGLALRMLFCLGWPVGILYSIGMFLQGSRFGPSTDAAGMEPTHSSGRSTMSGVTSIVALLGWLLLWPSWLLMRFVVAPATAHDSRFSEYQADAGARVAGLGGGLLRALERLQAWEVPRNAWDAALTASHPATELRIECLEDEKSPPPPDDIEGVSLKQASALGGLILILIAVAISPHVPVWHHSHSSWWW